MVGKTYRLRKSLRAVHADGDGKGFILVPEGALLVVDGYHDDSRILQVNWEEQKLFVFTEDLLQRGAEMRKMATPASGFGK